MKFCTKCGAELVDEAVLCTKCGCMVENQPTRPIRPTTPIKAVPTDTPPLEGKPSTLLIVSNFVHSIAVAISVFFLILSVGWAHVSAHLRTDKLGYITGVYANVYPAYGLLIPAIIFSGIAFLFGLLSFVMTLVEKHKGDRVLSSISRLAIGILSLACAIALMAN